MIRKPIAAFAAGACAGLSAAHATEYTAHIEGYVDLSGVSAADLHSIGLGAPGIYPFEIAVDTDDRMPDMNSSPQVGVYWAMKTQLTIGGVTSLQTSVLPTAPAGGLAAFDNVLMGAPPQLSDSIVWNVVPGAGEPHDALSNVSAAIITKNGFLPNDAIPLAQIEDAVANQTMMVLTLDFSSGQQIAPMQNVVAYVED